MVEGLVTVLVKAGEGLVTGLVKAVGGASDRPHEGRGRAGLVKAGGWTSDRAGEGSGVPCISWAVLSSNEWAKRHKFHLTIS